MTWRRGAMPSQHPILSGTLVGSIEICFTFPFEFVKRQLQLQQLSSALARRASVRFEGPLHCASHTMSASGWRGLYVGFEPFFLFAGPRSAIRFYSFEALSAIAGGGRTPAAATPSAAVDTACGFGAGLCEAALGQTPNQAISTKMLHDASPSGQRRFRSFAHAVSLIYAEHGFWRGFFCGIEPALIKGATTNAIRFPVFGALKQRLLERESAAGAQQPRSQLRPAEAVLAGATAGAVSAVATQPIDTVMAQAQGLESHRFRNSLHCAREIVAAGGVRALYFGVGPRVVRVMIEVGLQFSLYEAIAPRIDRLLGG